MAQEKSKLIFGAATPGGGFPAYRWPYAEVLSAADATLGIAPINTKGSTENWLLLEKSKIDLGLVTGEVTYEASTLANTLAAAPSRDQIQPGALQYMREAGLLQ